MEILHYPVLHESVLEYLALSTDEDAVMIDCTTGEGGHSNLFLERFPRLHVIGIDRDEEIQKKAIERLSVYPGRFKAVNAWFDDYLMNAESESADRILFDLGISIFHYEESRRGFSFRKDEPLDMRLNKNASLSAAHIVNSYSEEDLADLIYRYGEERYSRRIARAFVERRKLEPIKTSKEAEEIIFHAVPKEYRYGRINPATRTFQALRIEVNGELDRIRPSLLEAIRVLKRGGRIGVITFHSLEDRIVKWTFKDEEAKENPQIRIITKKPVIPTAEEEKENAPSRSAKLRVVEKI